MKDKTNQLFKDKFVLVMLVLGLIAIVAAVGTVTIRKSSQNLEESPYLEIQEPNNLVVSEKDTMDKAGGSELEESGAAVEPAGAEVLEHVYSGDQNHTGTSAAVEDANAQEAGALTEDSLALNFTETGKLAWPVQGNVILSYSMDKTIYFPTLEQYKCNPANVIQSEVSTPVLAPADAKVLEIGVNEEIGNFVRLDLGNEYTAICGQLKEIPVAVNEYLEKGTTLGYVAEPTKYYSVEGINLYFELLHAGEPVDALNFLE